MASLTARAASRLVPSRSFSAVAGRGSNKIVESAAAAVADVPDGATLLVGGPVRGAESRSQ